MARRERPALPQPPWVWGPAEVNTWIRSAYPSKGRQARSVRRGPEVITRLRIVVEGSDVERVRAAMAEAVKPVGIAMGPPAAGSRRHSVVGAFRRSLVGSRVHVSLRFEPPIRASSCRRILDRVGGRFRILTVSIREGRARLPPKPQ